MPPAEPAPDLSSRLLDQSHPQRENEGFPYSNWKLIADELKTAGYPMNLGASVGVDHFPSELRKKARDLDVHIESLFSMLRGRTTGDEAILAIRTAVWQGHSKDKFEKLMNEHNFSLKCNVIWESDAIAYRCNTCAKTPCMSLCAECFKGGNHEDHDVTRFFSREGGACDCGNDDVLKESGFCSKHGEHAIRPPKPPETIVSLSELILLRVVMLVLDHFRDYKRNNLFETVPKYMLSKSDRIDQVCGAGHLIALLQEFVDYGGPIRDACARILIDPEIYASIWMAPEENVLDNVSTRSFREFREKHKSFEFYSRETMGNQIMDDYFPEFPKEKMKTTCLLHELLFWMRVHIFPQSLINLTLVFLGDTLYRDEFARRFFLLYPWTSDSIKDTCNQDGVDYKPISMASSRIIHISVQMLSSAALCSRLTDDINLPKLMFGSVSFLLLSAPLTSVAIQPLRKKRTTKETGTSTASLEPIMEADRGDVVHERMEGNEEEEEEGDEGEEDPAPARPPNPILDGDHDMTREIIYAVDYWYTLDVDNSKVLYNHGYWFVMGDTQNLLSHPEVVSKMCRDENTMKTYFRVIEKMQCMDTIGRIESGDHLLNERPEDYQRALILEYEMSASSMFNLVFGIATRKDDEAAAAFYDACGTSIKKWMQCMDLENAGKPLQLAKKRITFHLPLSRHLSTLLAYTHDLSSIRERLIVLTSKENREVLHVLMLHPLRIQAARCEWSAGMWVRNGQQMRIPVCLYAQTHMLFSYYMPDLDLLRLCAANMDTADVLHAFFEAYSLADVFKWKIASAPSGVMFNSSNSHSLKRLEWVDTLVFGCLRLIADIVLLPGVSEQTAEESMRDDIVCKLAIMEMPHSRLRTSMAEKGSHGAELVDEYFEKILKEVAVFSDPEKDESLDQGQYSLSNQAQIDHLCPLLMMGRSTSQRHAANSLQRLEIIERRMAGRPEHQVKNVWTPYRLPSFEQAIKRRSEFNMGVYQLLVHERLLETYCYILAQYASDWEELERRLSGSSPSSSDVPHEFIFKDSTLQLVIYLLSCALLYMKTQDNKEELMKRLHVELSDMDGCGFSLATSILSIGPVVMAMNMKRGEISKEEEEKRVREMMREAVKGGIKDRLIAGTPAEYYGRLLAILYRDDGRFREMLDKRYTEIVHEAMEEDESSQPKDNTPNINIAKKRAAAEALRKRIMDDTKRSGTEMMKKLMLQERMTQEDLDSLDVSDKRVEQYECPICGDETPASFDNPIGLLVYVQFNCSYLNSIDASVEDKSLMELDEEMQKDGDLAKLRYQKHALFWRTKNMEVEHSLAGTHAELIATPSMIELKTCGHHAHIACLSQYRETIYHNMRGPDRRQEIIFCPKCRFMTNGLLPLKVRTGVEVNVAEQLRKGASESRLAVFDTLMEQIDAVKKNAVDLEEGESESNSSNYSLLTIKSVFESNLATRGTDAETFLHEKTHVFLQGLLIQSVERNLFFDNIGVSPARPKCIDLVCEHLNFHSPHLLSKEELNLTAAHVRELLVEEPTEMYEEQMVNEEDDPLEGPSGVWRRGIAQVEGFSNEDVAILVHRRKTTEDPDLSADMQCALTSPVVPKSELWRIFHRGLPTAHGETRLTRVRVRFSDEWKSRCKGEKAMSYDGRLPCLFVRPFALATRLTSLMMNSELTRESILESLRIVCRRLVGMAAVRWILFQCCRVDYGRLREWAEEEGETESDPREMARPKYLIGIRRVIARVFCSNASLSSMTKSLDRKELPTFEQSVLIPIQDLLMRIAQLWHEVRLCPLPEGVKSAVGMTREQLERQVLGATGIGPLPTHFLIAQWALNAIQPLTFITMKYMMLMEEPCSFRPFIMLRLPESYEDIFARYFGRTCRRCCRVPQNPMICLICSEMICLDLCCAGTYPNEQRFLEPEMHPCGVHIPFLALNSALIVLVKLKVEGLTFGCRASIWGSVYLDAHGEEDRNLRRGKPLKLAQKRVERLYREFLEGEAESRPNYHNISHLANLLRDAHYINQR